MYEVTKEIRFCYGHRLLQYEGKCRHLHGHNGRAVIHQREPVFVLDVNPTAENIAKLIFDHARSQGFPVREVRLWETDDSFAVYRPEK